MGAKSGGPGTLPPRDHRRPSEGEQSDHSHLTALLLTILGAEVDVVSV
jgi:hypothetical protein